MLEFILLLCCAQAPSTPDPRPLDSLYAARTIQHSVTFPKGHRFVIGERTYRRNRSLDTVFADVPRARMLYRDHARHLGLRTGLMLSGMGAVIGGTVGTVTMERPHIPAAAAIAPGLVAFFVGLAFDLRAAAELLRALEVYNAAQTAALCPEDAVDRLSLLGLRASARGYAVVRDGVRHRLGRSFAAQMTQQPRLEEAFRAHRRNFRAFTILYAAGCVLSVGGSVALLASGREPETILYPIAGGALLCAVGVTFDMRAATHAQRAVWLYNRLMLERARGARGVP